MPSTPEIRRAKRLARRAAVEGETGTYAREQNDAVTHCVRQCVAMYRCVYTVEAVTVQRYKRGCGVGKSDHPGTAEDTQPGTRVGRLSFYVSFCVCMDGLCRPSMRLCVR